MRFYRLSMLVSVPKDGDDLRVEDRVRLLIENPEAGIQYYHNRFKVIGEVSAEERQGEA